MNKNIRNLTLKRQFAEKRFKFYGQISLFLALVMLVVIISSMTYRSIPAFTNYGLNLNINLSENDIDKDDINYRRLIRENIFALDSGCEDRKCRREFSRLFSSGAAYDLKDSIENNPSLIKKNFNKFILFSDDADLFYKFGIDKNLPENERRLNDREISWLNDFQEEGLVEKRFSTNFFTNGDSREPEIAGVLGAVVGSLFTILITLIISFPIGVFSAITVVGLNSTVSIPDRVINSLSSLFNSLIEF